MEGILAICIKNQNNIPALSLKRNLSRKIKIYVPEDLVVRMLITK